MTSVLHGIRVIDLSRDQAGAYASMMMADYGAEVIVLEPPEGGAVRAASDFPVWHRGKKSAIADLSSADGVNLAKRLASQADIVIHDFRPGEAEQLGLGYDELKASNPGLIYCALSVFGLKGKLSRGPQYEGLLAARVGAMDHFGRAAGREDYGYPTAKSGAFNLAHASLQGVLTALYVRCRTGHGQRIDASMVQALTASDVKSWMMQWVDELEPGKFDVVDADFNSEISFTLPIGRTKDGRWLRFTLVAPRFWKPFITALDLEWIWDDASLKKFPRFESDEAKAQFRELFFKAVSQKTSQEWQALIDEREDLNAELFRLPEQALDHPQMIHDEFIVEVDDPRLGAVKQLAPIVKMSASPGKVRGPVPELGADANEIHAMAEQQRNERAFVPENGETNVLPKRPLEGLLVLDFSMYYACPFAANILADYGARVIKPEPPTGDYDRLIEPKELFAVKTVQGKESIALDIKTEAGRKIAHELVKKADIVLHNFRHGAAARLGLDHETLFNINPNLVYVYGVGYGMDGPYASRPCYAPASSSVAGYSMYQGSDSLIPPPDQSMTIDEVERVAKQIGEACHGTGFPSGAAAMAVASAAMLGLAHRERTGQGQWMMTTMLHSNTWIFGEDASVYEGKPRRRHPDKDLQGMSALERIYETSDGRAFLECRTEAEWQRLCQALALPSDDTQFANAEMRSENDAALVQLIQQALLQKTAAEWEDYLLDFDLGCVRVRDGGHIACTDPLMMENGYTYFVHHPSFGFHPRHGPLVEFSGMSGIAEGGDFNGANSRAILRELGYSEGQIESLESDKVVVSLDD